MNSCPIGYFANNQTYECVNCKIKYSNSCLLCNSTSCIQCINTYLLHNGACLINCPNQHYKSSQTCQKCVAPCLECYSFTQCASCISPYLYSSGSCIIQCPFGKISFLNFSSNNLICIPCQSPCITCQNTPTNCTMCIYGYFLYLTNNTCTTDCSIV